MRISSSEDMQKSMSKEIADLRRHKAELESEFRKKDQDLDQSRSHADALDKVRFMFLAGFQVFLIIPLTFHLNIHVGSCKASYSLVPTRGTVEAG